MEVAYSTKFQEIGTGNNYNELKLTQGTHASRQEIDQQHLNSSSRPNEGRTHRLLETTSSYLHELQHLQLFIKARLNICWLSGSIIRGRSLLQSIFVASDLVM